jgi:hypothetical protein
VESGEGGGCGRVFVGEVAGEVGKGDVDLLVGVVEVDAGGVLFGVVSEKLTGVGGALGDDGSGRRWQRGKGAFCVVGESLRLRNMGWMQKETMRAET